MLFGLHPRFAGRILTPGRFCPELSNVLPERGFVGGALLECAPWKGRTQMKKRMVVSLIAWSLLFMAMSAWFLYLVDWHPGGWEWTAAFALALILFVWRIRDSWKMMESLKNTEEKCEFARALTEGKREALEELRKKFDNCVSERANLEYRCCRLSQRSREALRILALNITCLRAMVPPQVNREALKNLRMNNLEAALALFEGMEEFTWKPEEVSPSACRDFVVDMIRRHQVNIKEPYIADFICFAHRKGDDEQTAAQSSSGSV